MDTVTLFGLRLRYFEIIIIVVLVLGLVAYIISLKRIVRTHSVGEPETEKTEAPEPDEEEIHLFPIDETEPKPKDKPKADDNANTTSKPKPTPRNREPEKKVSYLSLAQTGVVLEIPFSPLELVKNIREKPEEPLRLVKITIPSIGSQKEKEKDV